MKGKHYYPHDNGGRPFMVSVKGKEVSIYKLRRNFIYEEMPQKKDYTELVKSYKNTSKVFVGEDKLSTKDSKFSLGNTVLVHLTKNKYVFIGAYVYEFETKDLIKEYYSPVIGSDVSYPIAIDSKNIYFLIDDGRYGYLPKNYVYESETEYYDWNSDIAFYMDLWDQAWSGENTKKIKNIKVIQKRKS